MLGNQERFENSLCAFLLLDLGELVATERGRNLGIPKSRLWLAHQTQANLQELSGCIAIACISKPDHLDWLPFRSSELPLEQWFGWLRKQFPNSQFRARDFCHASARKTFQQFQKIKSMSTTWSPQMPKSLEDAVSDEEYIQCADRALTSALKLMSACCEHLGGSCALHGMNT